MSSYLTNNYYRYAYGNPIKLMNGYYDNIKYNKSNKGLQKKDISLEQKKRIIQWYAYF